MLFFLGCNIAHDAKYYGQYYIGNARIDQNVVEVADQNPNYRMGKDEVNEIVLQDTNPQYGPVDDNNEHCATVDLEDDDNMNEPIEDDDGYARLPIRTMKTEILA